MLSLTTTPIRSYLAATRPRVSYAIWFPLAVYAIARLVDISFVLIAAHHQVTLTRGATGLAGYNIWESSPASPGYGTVASNWDGQWCGLLTQWVWISQFLIVTHPPVGPPFP